MGYCIESAIQRHSTMGVFINNSLNSLYNYDCINLFMVSLRRVVSRGLVKGSDCLRISRTAS